MEQTDIKRMHELAELHINKDGKCDDVLSRELGALAWLAAVEISVLQHQPRPRFTPPRYDEVWQEGMETLDAEDTLIFDPASKTYTLAEIKAKYPPNRDMDSEAAVSTSKPFSIMDYL